MKAETSSARDYTGHNEYGLLDGWDKIREYHQPKESTIGEDEVMVQGGQ